jgi:hypothetical protein
MEKKYSSMAKRGLLLAGLIGCFHFGQCSLPKTRLSALRRACPSVMATLPAIRSTWQVIKALILMAR